MDFGLVGTTPTIDGYQLQQHQQHHHILEGKPKYNNNNNNINNENGSGQMKQERSDPFDKDEDDRASKMAKHVVDFGLRSDTTENNNNNINSINTNTNNINNINNNNKQQMLSFSSSNDDIKPQVVSFLSSNNNNNDKNGFSFAPYYTNSTTSPGFGCGNMNGGMHGSFTGIRGPFTPAQWIELEHQAMIYKYLTANVPVPSNLLIPIRKAIQSAGFPGFSIASYPSLSYGWGSFHLGFTGNTDPEPGRCRRTDGKKWRCSRDAVPDQKYCERHINRGRHRSRKPVEGHTGQAASGAATPTTAKVVPVMPSAMSSSLVSSGGGVGGGVPNGIATAQHHVKGLQPTAGAINASTDLNTKRLNDQQGLSVMSTTMNLESKDSRYSIPKQHFSYEESSLSDFGVVSNDSFLNPTQKSSYLDIKSYNSLSEFNIPQTQDQYPLRHFMDNDVPKEHSHHSHKDPPNPDWTQLSMSIPISTDFSSSSPSPIQDKVGVGSRVGPIMAEGGTKENGWTQIAWGSSMGGPLGEVLLNNNTSNVIDKDERWDGSSPTGVLQRSTFVPYSNSSSIGSPRADQMMTRDDLLGSAARTTSSSIPSV